MAATHQSHVSNRSGAPPGVLAAQDNSEEILQAISEGATLGSLRGLRRKDMEAIYAVAHNLYSYGQFQEAEKVFQFLCFYGHLEQKYWQGLGGCRQALGKYEQAVESYAMMAICDAGDPTPAYYASQCFFHLGRNDEAYKALLAVMDLSSNAPRYRSLRTRAQRLLANRKKSQSASSQNGKASQQHSDGGKKDRRKTSPAKGEKPHE